VVRPSSDDLGESDPPLKAPRLFDAVTLRNFGIVEHLSVLKHLQSAHQLPCWAHSVREEILTGLDQRGCMNVLAASFLGTPQATEPEDLKAVIRLQIALGGGIGRPSSEHLGEAESLVLADKFHGYFVTDDNAAYDLASRQLGHLRVFDTVDILREAVVTGYFTTSEARRLADAIRNAGRHLRRAPPIHTFAPVFSARH
jgi:predicted nucleic acid-binding protein